MEKQTVNIPLERYEELVKKEVLFDKIMEGKDVSVYPYTKVDENEGRCQP